MGCLKVILGIVVVLLTGCCGSKVDEYKETVTTLASDSGSLLGRRSLGEEKGSNNEYHHEGQ